MKGNNIFDEHELEIYKELKARFYRYKSAVFTQEEFPKFESTIKKLVEENVLKNSGVSDAHFYLMVRSFQKYEAEFNRPPQKSSYPY